MDTKTLIIAATVAALATTLSMAVVFWTRLTYRGFGYWLAGIGCRVLAGLLFLLPRDQFPPWLTIVLANYLMLAELMLYLRGTLIFRGQPLRHGWDLVGSLPYIALLGYFSYVMPSINLRIVASSLCYAAWDIWLIRVLLSHRPPYFGSTDRLQAGVLGVLAAASIARAWYVWMFAPPLTDYLSGPVFQGPWILLLMLTSLLIALSQVMMNAQRLEYDLRIVQGQLEQARRAAEAANAAKSEFLAHMSHEIRTPLNAVLGLAQVLDREPLRDHQRDMVGRIQDAGRSLLAILNQVLDLSKIEAGQLRLEAGPFDPAVLLAHIDRLMGPSALAKGLTLRVAGPATPPGMLVGDALRLQQVLLNLIGNAIKFTEQGEVVLRVAAVAADASSVRLRFAIRDTGIGIAPAALQRLFTPFTQADTGIMRRFGGTGLGLAISKRLVELLGGEIGVDSTVGQGSTFWFELPFARVAARETPVSASVADAVPQPPTGPRLSGAHLLVVDDSAMNRDLVERVLRLEGARATPAADGQQALQLLKTSPTAFDAVLMDVRMPVMDGLTATRLMRGELGLAELPVIALTAGVLPEEQEAAARAGVNDLLTKPLDLEQLVALLVKWFEPRPAGGGRTAAGRDLASAPVNHDGVVATETLPDIAGIDRVQTAQTLGQNRALFLHLLTLFTEEFADAVAQTRHDLAAGARESAARRLHTLAGSAGNLGAMDLMGSVRALEAALAQEGVSSPDLGQRLAAFERQLGAFLAAIAPWRAFAEVPAGALGTDTTAAPAPRVDPIALAAQLDTLREALRRHRAQARHHFNELEPALRVILGDQATRAVGLAIRDLRFDVALAELESVRGDTAVAPAPGMPINRNSG